MTTGAGRFVLVMGDFLSSRAVYPYPSGVIGTFGMRWFISALCRIF